MATKRKAEGIALLSLYNDEDEEEDMEADELEEEDNDQVQKQISQSPKDGEMGNEFAPSLEKNTSLQQLEKKSPSPSLLASPIPATPPESVVPSPNPNHAIGSTGAAGIVDYDHDEATMSPEAEEGEIMNTGRAVISLETMVSVEKSVIEAINHHTPEKTSGQVDIHIDTFNIKVSQMVGEVASETTDGIPTEENGTASVEDTEQLHLDDFLPPPPTDKCSEELQNKFYKYMALKNEGKSFNEELRKSKGYRNPDFLQRAVRYHEIDQVGSCFRKEVFDPHGYDPSDYYDALAAFQQKRELEKKEQERKQTQRVDFVRSSSQASGNDAHQKVMVPAVAAQKVPGIIPPSGNVSSVDNSGRSDSRQNKKSKWDKVEPEGKILQPLPVSAHSAMAAASAHAALVSANAGAGYASFAQKKRKEAEEKTKLGSGGKFDRKLDRS